MICIIQEWMLTELDNPGGPGYPINTYADEITLVVNAKGCGLYFK